MAKVAGRALVASALFTAWACAKATDSDLGGSVVDSNAGKPTSGGAGGTMPVNRGGTGGSSASSTGGTSSGKGGTGTGGSSTGGSSTGGSSTGGTGNGGNGGNGGTLGGSSNGGSGGNAGDDGVPPDVLARAKVVLRHIARNHSSSSNAVDVRLFFENKSDDALDLSNVKVRYWTTLEGSWGNLACYYAAILGKENVTLSYVEDGDDSNVLIGFKDGSVPAHNGSPFTNTEFQMKVDAQNGGTFDQDDDWSYAPLTADNPPEPNDKITVYLADKLVWGCEPSGSCAGEGGAGGQGGQGGEAGQPGTGGTGQGGSVSAGQGGEPASGQGGA